MNLTTELDQSTKNVIVLDTLYQLVENFKIKKEELDSLAEVNPDKTTYKNQASFTKGVVFGIEMVLKEFAAVNNLKLRT